MAATCLLLMSGFLSGLGGAGTFAQGRIGFFVLGLIACLLVSALSLVVFLVVLARAAGGALVNGREKGVGPYIDISAFDGVATLK
jgi:hypothetical protein